MALPDDAPERKMYAGVHTVGLPDHWYPTAQEILRGNAIRKEQGLTKHRRDSGESQMVGDETVLYLSGFKDPEKEASALQQLLAIDTINGKPLLVHFRPHPGEKSRPELAESVAKRDALLQDQWQISSTDILTGDRAEDARLIGASDLALVHPGATSIFLAAALRRKMLAVMEFVQPQELASSSYDYSQTQRYVHVVVDIASMHNAVAGLIDETSAASVRLRNTQEKNALPMSVEGEYAKNVAAIMHNLLSRSS